MSNLPEKGPPKTKVVLGTPLTPPRRAYGAMHAMHEDPPERPPSAIEEEEDRRAFEEIDKAIAAVEDQANLESAAQALHEIQAEEAAQRAVNINVFVFVLPVEKAKPQRKSVKKRAPAKRSSR